MVKVAIRGLGKAGRLFLTKYGVSDPNIEIVEIIDDAAAVNVANTVYLLKYNSTYKRFEGPILADVENNAIILAGKSIPVKTDADGLPALAYSGAEVLIDFTGNCTVNLVKEAQTSGVNKIISNNILDDSYPCITDVNMSTLTIYDNVVSTSPDLAATSSILDVFNKEFSLKEGYITFIKSASSAMTADDDYVASGDFDAGRSCMENIVVGNNGSAAAIGNVIPVLRGKVSGTTVRVPSLSGFMAQITILNGDKSCTADEINVKLNAAASGLYSQYLKYSDDYITPMDTRGLFATTFAAKKTKVSDNLINIYAYYYPEEVACNMSYRLANYMMNL